VWGDPVYTILPYGQNNHRENFVKYSGKKINLKFKNQFFFNSIWIGENGKEKNLIENWMENYSFYTLKFFLMFLGGKVRKSTFRLHPQPNRKP